MSKINAFGSVRLFKLGAASVAAILAFSTATAMAQDFMSERKISAMHGQVFNSERADHIRYDHSGTRGREGLGANPGYPEGPGNLDH